MVFNIICVANIHAFPINDYFPTEPGSRWTYLKNGISPSITSVSNAVTSGVSTKAFTNSGDTTHYIVNSAGLYIFKYTEGITGSIATLSPAARLANADFNVGNSITTNGILTIFVVGVGNVNLNYSLTSTIEAFETITVPADTYSTFRVRVTLNVNGTILGTPFNETEYDFFWLAQDIGAVKHINLFQGTTDTFELSAHNIDLDPDSDGISKRDDNCPSVSNFQQTDTDGDGVGDACDTDDDNDGVPDINDVFPLDAAESVDSDNDGVGDGADLFPNDPNETLDSDTDGVGDNGDNCPNDANPSQTNTDGDSQGNVCDADDDNDSVPDHSDPFPLDPTESFDTDNDGIGNNSDNCPIVANAGQEDVDNDNIGDVCDRDLLNDAPELTKNTKLDVTQGETGTIGNSLLLASDPDDTASDIFYTVTIPPQQGRLEFSDNPGDAISAFTQADINANRVVYVQNGMRQVENLYTEFELSSLLGVNGGDGSNGFTLNGNFSTSAGSDRSGFSVSDAGDVNGDGISDIIIGAYTAYLGAFTTNQNGPERNVGKSYVVFGKGSTFSPEFELRSLFAANGGNGTNGFVINGIHQDGYSGQSVSSAGDINGDGYSDILINSSASPNGHVSGQSYVVFGKASQFPAEINLSSLLAVNGGDGSAGFILNGINIGDRSSFSLSNAGDVNSDGFDDILIGAIHADPNGFESGESYLVFGKPAFSAEFELSTLLATNGGDGSNGVVFNGINSGDSTGYVANAGDINGDGISDILIGAPNFASNGIVPGQAYVVFGKNTVFPAEFELSSLLATNGGDGSNGFVLKGINIDDRAGFSVSSAGDVNSDGISDILIGALNSDPNSAESSGQTYIIFGKSTAFSAEFELSSLLTANGGDGSAGFVINGIDPFDGIGSAISNAGDINNDGLDDILLGSFMADANGVLSGESYIIFGKDSMFPAEFELSSLLTANGGDGTNGFILNGINANDNSGRSVSNVGDVNNDGVADIIIGAPEADPTGGASGQSYVVFGQPHFVDGFSFRLTDGGEDGAKPITARFNFNVIAGTDTDGDGVSDNVDVFPTDASEYADADNDGIGNNADTDDDNDTVLDTSDNCPFNSNTTQTDTDGDGAGDACDTDDDNDNVLDVNDALPLDSTESVDTDNDGIGNNADTDDDNDNVLDINDAFPLDSTESVDTDNDGIGNNTDTDDDNDNVLDINDAFPLDSTESVDTDNDGIGNNADTDDDNDTMSDVYEIANNLDPLVNDAGLDKDSDTLTNLQEFQLGTEANNADTDGDGLDDGAEVAAGRNPALNEGGIISIINSIF